MITSPDWKPAARQIATAWRWPPERRRTRLVTAGTSTASVETIFLACQRMPCG